LLLPSKAFRGTVGAMGVLVGIAIVVVAILAISWVGDWLYNKTGWVLAAIVAGAITTYLLMGTVSAYKESVKPDPYLPAAPIGANVDGSK
jgi:hypothetical protein